MALFASKHIYKERLTTCKSCEHFQKMALVCKSCGCFMPAKAKIANLRCPEDKWTEVYGTEQDEPETITLVSDVKKTETREEKSSRLLKMAIELRTQADRLEMEARGIKR